MRRKFPKILYFFICFLLIFQQSGFAQVAGELNIAGHLNALHNTLIVEKFRPLHLRYISYDNLNNNFKLLLDKGDSMKGLSLQGALPEERFKDETKTLLNFFFIGISLPNDSFWVNLRPDSPDNIIDPYLAQTDLGKILLEADLQLKKDTANFTSPQTPEGKVYWNKLYQKVAELFGPENITIPTLTRPWIVPNEIIIRESSDNAYIYKATLKVMLEQDYLKDSATYNFTDERLRQLNEYSSQLIRETIIPKLTKDVNTAKRYAPLRQVYYSLILSQWFKQKFYGKSGLYSHLINKQNLTGLTSKETWSKDTYFQAYQKSFKEGEYNIKEQAYSLGTQTLRNYMSGGIALGNITSTIASSAIVSKREMFKGVRNLVELVVSGSQTANDLSNVEINRRDFLKLTGGAAGAAALALKPGVAQAIDYLAASKPSEGAYNQYRISPEYLGLLRKGLAPKFGYIADSFLKECITYSNSNKSLEFVSLAYGLLDKAGFSSGKQYKILFLPGLKTTNKAIVLEDLIIVGQDLFQWLKPGILEKWLAVKILQERIRLENNEKTIFEREDMAHKATLQLMEKMGNMPNGCLAVERMLLETFQVIKGKLGVAKGIDYDPTRQIMFNKKTGILSVPFELKEERRPYVFPIGTGKILIGDTYPNDEVDIFEMQEGFLLSSSMPGAFAGATITTLQAANIVSPEKSASSAVISPEELKDLWSRAKLVGVSEPGIITQDSEALKVNLQVCYAVVTRNRNTDEIRLIHIFPTVPMNFRPKPATQEEYLNAQLKNINKSDWEIAVISSKANNESDASSLVTPISVQDIKNKLKIGEEDIITGGIIIDSAETEKDILVNGSGEVFIINPETKELIRDFRLGNNEQPFIRPAKENGASSAVEAARNTINLSGLKNQPIERYSKEASDNLMTLLKALGVPEGSVVLNIGYGANPLSGRSAQGVKIYRVINVDTQEPFGIKEGEFEIWEKDFFKISSESLKELGLQKKPDVILFYNMRTYMDIYGPYKTYSRFLEEDPLLNVVEYFRKASELVAPTGHILFVNFMPPEGERSGIISDIEKRLKDRRATIFKTGDSVYS